MPEEYRHHGFTDFHEASPAAQLPDWPLMANEFTFSITTSRFDDGYTPSDSSRITTNFANLARG